MTIYRRGRSAFKAEAAYQTKQHTFEQKYFFSSILISSVNLVFCAIFLNVNYLSIRTYSLLPSLFMFPYLCKYFCCNVKFALSILSPAALQSFQGALEWLGIACSFGSKRVK